MVFEGGASGKKLRLDEIRRGGPRDTINALIKRGRDMRSFSLAALRKYKKIIVYNPERETKLSGTIILNFPAPRTVGNKCLLSKPPKLW